MKLCSSHNHYTTAPEKGIFRQGKNCFKPTKEFAQSLFNIVLTQVTFICSKSPLETLEKMPKMFKVNNKNTRAT